MMETKQRLPATILVIFGISGDLSHRYLLPALSQVCGAGRLPKDFKILGISRRDIKVGELFREAEKNLVPHTAVLKMDLSESESYTQLDKEIKKIASGMQDEPQIIFYLVIPPAGVLQVIRHLGQAGLNKATKLLLEKPFGTDLDSAKDLIAQIDQFFSEDQVYRIDHYLAKGMAQNITVFLGSNTIFRDIWSNQFIEKIEVLSPEKIDIEGRVAFYENTGALRDYVQSHLLQLAALTLMEPCSDIFDFEEIPRRRLAALEAIKSVDPTKARRGQYRGYAQEVKNPNSLVETFVDLTLESADPRWADVPIRLVTGKALDQKLTEVRVYFKKTHSSATNCLVLRIQPKEAVELDLWVKEPGYERRLQKLPLSFTYSHHFERIPDAYEQVLIDAIKSNHSLFASSAEVLASWRILEPLQKHWSMSAKDLYIYKPGSTLEEITEQSARS